MLDLDARIEIAARHDEPKATPFHFPIVYSPSSTPGWFDGASHCQYVSTCMSPKVDGRVPRFELLEKRVLDHPVQALQEAVVSAGRVLLLKFVLRRLAAGRPAALISIMHDIKG